MKKILLLIFVIKFLSLPLYSQKRSPEEIRDFFWSADDAYQSVMEVPQKWANESAVILYQEFNYHYRNTRKGLDYTESLRRRIKVQDKSSVEEYSEFSVSERYQIKKGFSKKGGRSFAGFKVIKPDGKEILIDMKDAVEVKNEGAEIFKKIAIPDLQPGDIIDYYFYLYEPFIAMGTHVFKPVVSQLSSSYPIVKQKMEFNTGKSFYVNFKSVNGAPELQKIPNDDKKEMIYQLIDQDREKQEQLRWFYARRVVPTIKFQVSLARKENDKIGLKAFFGEKGTIKKDISHQDLLKYYSKRYRFKKKKLTNGNIVIGGPRMLGGAAIKSNPKLKAAIKNKRKADIVKEAYFHLRYNKLVGRIEPINFLQEGFIYGLPIYYGDFMTEDEFIDELGHFLKKENIDFDIVLALSRSISTADELLMPEEVTPIIRVNLPKPLYLSEFDIHSTPGSFSYYLEGAESLLINLDDNYKMTKIESFKLPTSTIKQNQSSTKLEITFEDDQFDQLKINRRVSHQGHNKKGEQFDLLILDDAIQEDYQYYEIAPYIERAKMTKKSRKKVVPKLKIIAEKNKEDQKKVFEEKTKNDFDMPIKSYDSYSIIQHGRQSLEDPMIFEDKFHLENLTKRAGKNFLFEVGKLIGGQVAIAADEQERTLDIFMPYPRSFRNEITIEIPAGYSVEGLDKLNVKVENSTGGFVATAKIKGQQLTLSTHKFYKHQFEKAAQWKDMTTFLEAAYDYTQTKILFKKI